ANGAITTIDNSRKATYGYDQRVEAFGANGMASSANQHDVYATIATGDGFRQPRLQDFFLERYAQSYLDQWAAFVSYVDGPADAQSPASGADGRAPLVIAMAATRSMEQHRPVQISEIEQEHQ
ncbi:MAG: inositol 2-dehydrogenase, partial [Actinomycetota bacterium]